MTASVNVTRAILKLSVVRTLAIVGGVASAVTVKVASALVPVRPVTVVTRTEYFPLSPKAAERIV